MSDRLARERDFHDSRFGDEAEGRAADRFYAINQASDRYFRAEIESLPPGRKLLDYGCGDAAYVALHAASCGHQVTGIDISPVAIEKAERRAESLGLADNIDFKVMNAEELEFEPDSFDVVGGLGVVHHLDLGSSLDNVTKVLKPGGRAFFVEPLGHNPLINAYRDRTPDQRSEDEHPLLESDLEEISGRFEEASMSYFHLLGLLATPVGSKPWSGRLVERLDALDRRLFDRLPALRKHAWMVGMSLAGPR